MAEKHDHKAVANRVCPGRQGVSGKVQPSSAGLQSSARRDESIVSEVAHPRVPRLSGGVAARPTGQDVQQKVGGAEVEPLRQVDGPDAAGESGDVNGLRELRVPHDGCVALTGLG